MIVSFLGETSSLCFSPVEYFVGSNCKRRMLRRQKVGNLMFEGEACSIRFKLGSAFSLEFCYSCHPKLRICKLSPLLWDKIAELELLETAWGNHTVGSVCTF